MASMPSSGAASGPYFTQLEGGPHVLAQHRVYLGILQNTVFNHLLCAAVCGVFLGGLENQLDGAVKGVLQLLEHVSRAQQHGGVGIVTAGMGHAGVERGEGQAGAFGKLEGVHVGPQAHALAWSRSLNQGGNAVAAHMLCGFQAHVPKDLGHIGGGLLLLPAGFRMLVEPAAVLLNLFPVFVNDTAQFRHKYASSIRLRGLSPKKITCSSLRRSAPRWRRYGRPAG